MTPNGRRAGGIVLVIAGAAGFAACLASASHGMRYMMATAGASAPPAVPT